MAKLYSQSTAALIPTFNDDYSLYLCLQSVAPYFDEVWVHDDGSNDRTEIVIDWAKQLFKNIRSHQPSTQVGWTNSIVELFSLSNARHIFRIDSDDVLYPEFAGDIERIVNGENSCLLFGLQECWGDFHHSRRGLEICHDPTHFYVDREKCNVTWVRGSAPHFWPVAQTSEKKQNWPKALFFHMPGVKSDERCVLRTLIGDWEAAGKPYPLFEWPPYKELSGTQTHAEALQWLLYHNNNLRTLTQIPEEIIPKICKENERFELIKDNNGNTVDRLDHGWLFSNDEAQEF